MPRQARKESSTGIFHVMMRGINHQNIFEDESARRASLRVEDNLDEMLAVLK